jgi:hypothetical protein
MPTSDRLLLADGEHHRAVERQNSKGCPARRRKRHNTLAVPAEVFRPDLRSRVKKRNLLAGFWVDCRLVSPLAG